MVDTNADHRTETSAHRLVKYALAIGAIELLPEGRKLKSGRISPYFFNSGLFKDGNALDVLGESYAESIIDSQICYDMVYGPAYKGITLVAATSMFLARYQMPNSFAFNRKEAKDHGEGGLIVGTPLKDMRVVIVDDVITDGAAKREAKVIIENEGGSVAGIVIGFDRQERGQSDISAIKEFERDYGMPVIAGANLQDLIDVLEETKEQFSERAAILPKIYEYRSDYGI